MPQEIYAHAGGEISCRDLRNQRIGISIKHKYLSDEVLRRHVHPVIKDIDRSFQPAAQEAFYTVLVFPSIMVTVLGNEHFHINFVGPGIHGNPIGRSRHRNVGQDLVFRCAGSTT